MFKDSFFKVLDIRKAEEKYFADLSFDSQHKIFKGHFPEKKVVPGVMLMQIIKEVAETILEVDNTMITDAGMKFLNPVLVDESSDVEVEMTLEKTDEGSYKIKSIGKDREKKSFKINITLTK